jgi:hypothetical protein
MIIPAMLVTALGLVIHVAETVPRYDVRSTCRAAVTLAAVGGSPSYVELLICLEMMQDSRKHHEDERAAKTRKTGGKT